MPGNDPLGFPPGEIGARFNQIQDLQRGEFVYVRMMVWLEVPSELDSFALKLARPAVSPHAFSCLWVPRSQIVCREPKVMEADGGVVRPVDIER